MLAQAYWENQLPSCGKKQSQRRLQSPRHPGIQFHVQSNLVLWLSCTVLEKLVSSSLSTSSYTSDSLATFRNYRISYYIGRSHIKPERNLHSFSSVPITGVILQCASHVTEVRQITPPPLTTQRLSPPGTLGINTWGKRASVNFRGNAKCHLSGTTQGSGRELRTTVFFWCAFPSSAQASAGDQASTHDMPPAGCHILPYFIPHPKASQILFKHSMMFDSMICHSVKGSQRQHRGERRERHWQIYPTAPNCS